MTPYTSGFVFKVAERNINHPDQPLAGMAAGGDKATGGGGEEGAGEMEGQQKTGIGCLHPLQDGPAPVLRSAAGPSTFVKGRRVPACRKAGPRGLRQHRFPRGITSSTVETWQSDNPLSQPHSARASFQGSLARWQ